MFLGSLHIFWVSVATVAKVFTRGPAIRGAGELVKVDE